MTEKEQAFVLSDGSRINSHGFRVNLGGGRFERFDANPVLLYDHDTDKLIGKWADRRIENGKMLARPVFDLNDPFAAEKARKVREGFLNGASMGIHILKLDYINDEYVATEWELKEASITPIPSDSGAVRLYDENRKELSFDDVKLNFETQPTFNNSQMEKPTINLAAATVTSLELSTGYGERDIEIAVTKKDETIRNLTANLQTQQNTAIDTFLSTAVKDGKITADQKTEYAELSKLSDEGYAKVQKIINGIDSKPRTSLRDQQSKTDLTAGRESWDYLKWAKEDPKGLADIKLNNPTEFAHIQSTF